MSQRLAETVARSVDHPLYLHSHACTHAFLFYAHVHVLMMLPAWRCGLECGLIGKYIVYSVHFDEGVPKIRLYSPGRVCVPRYVWTWPKLARRSLNGPLARTPGRSLSLTLSFHGSTAALSNPLSHPPLRRALRLRLRHRSQSTLPPRASYCCCSPFLHQNQCLKLVATAVITRSTAAVVPITDTRLFSSLR
jgi:hypothetical protein